MNKEELLEIAKSILQQSPLFKKGEDVVEITEVKPSIFYAYVASNKKGFGQLVIGEDGKVLWASSGIDPEKLVSEYIRGKRTVLSGDVFRYIKGSFMPNNISFLEVVVSEDAIYIDDGTTVKTILDKAVILNVFNFLKANLQEIEQSYNLSATADFEKATARDEFLLKLNDKKYYLSSFFNDQQIKDTYLKVVNGVLDIIK